LLVIKTSTHVSDKSYAYISLNHQSNLLKSGLVCNLGKQMAVPTD